jgi:putative transposase
VATAQEFFVQKPITGFIWTSNAACDKHHCNMHACVLMTNHAHLLLTPHNDDSIGKAMRMVGRYYVRYYN